MKHITRLITVLSSAAFSILACCNVGLAADKDMSASQAGKQPMLLAQNAPKKAKAGKRAGPNVDQNGVILKGYDPVAYFKKGKAVKGNPKNSSSFEGATYYFASAADKKEFDKNPARYQPQYGAWCAHAMAKGKLSDIDPNAFAIYKNKLYVCSDPGAAADFKANAATQAPEADDNWRHLVGS
jgi:YHS domain-containing protein